MNLCLMGQSQTVNKYSHSILIALKTVKTIQIYNNCNFIQTHKVNINCSYGSLLKNILIITILC